MTINTSLSTFMKMAVTVTVIGSVIFGGLYLTIKDLSDDVNSYIENS